MGAGLCHNGNKIITEPNQIKKENFKNPSSDNNNRDQNIWDKDESKFK